MFKSKTTWTCILGALGGLSAILTNEATLAEGSQIILTSLIGLFLRHGVSKTQVTADAAAKSAAKMEASAAEIVAMKKPVVKAKKMAV
tara:strand:- start:360 stop:623 length:264 start_codon:yes stop_codon:yes gene_type:complete